MSTASAVEPADAPSRDGCSCVTGFVRLQHLEAMAQQRVGLLRVCGAEYPAKGVFVGKRDRLGWPGGVLEGADWGKPKGMHWRTYERLCDEYDALNDIMSCNFMARFGLMVEFESPRA